MEFLSTNNAIEKNELTKRDLDGFILLESVNKNQAALHQTIRSTLRSCTRIWEILVVSSSIC